jgi:hypothetical protein
MVLEKWSLLLLKDAKPAKVKNSAYNRLLRHCCVGRSIADEAASHKSEKLKMGELAKEE